MIQLAGASQLNISSKEDMSLFQLITNLFMLGASGLFVAANGVRFVSIHQFPPFGFWQVDEILGGLSNDAV